MIERWFPCAEVSEASYQGWGSGNSEASLFTWFAKRPLAQARAATLTSLLPWPEDIVEQQRLQELVRRALKGYNDAYGEVVQELRASYAGPPATLDPFAGRAMLPLEAARYDALARGIDYSPVAVLAGRLLAEYPLRDWAEEPGLPLPGYVDNHFGDRLLSDAQYVIEEVGRRFRESMSTYYPSVNGAQPWGYLWAVSLPCQECGASFPMTGSLVLRHPMPSKGDPGQSYRINVDKASRKWEIEVHQGSPTESPTRVLASKSKYDAAGKVAVCPFCEHVHPKDVHTRLAFEGQGHDELLLAADLDDMFSKHFRVPTPEERAAVRRAERDLAIEPEFLPGLAATPDERIPPGNTWTVQASVYGAKTYADMCNSRQTLGFVHLSRAIADLGREFLNSGVSPDYATALCGYATSVLVRKMRRATRGATLQVYADGRATGVNDIFATESSLACSYDYFEAALGDGPGSWESVSVGTIAALRKQLARRPGRPAVIERGSAISLPLRDRRVDAVIMDPPYDAMIDYTDASDLFYVWIKRSMSGTDPGIAFTADPHGVQEKTEEIIVKKGGTSSNDPRTRQRYDELIARAFAEARRVVKDDGVVTIVFGHGEPEVWHRLLSAITAAGLVLTSSWPAKTEKGGKAGFSNIVTTLTMSCRPAPVGRRNGRASIVEAEVRNEVQARIPMWDAAGLAPTDQLMASAGPAMEVVGRYEQVLDHLGDPVDPAYYLIVARKAIGDATAVLVDDLPLDTFDARTRFALSWVRLYRRTVAAKSEARWQALASDLTLDALKGVLAEADKKGVRLAPAKAYKGTVTPASSTIDVAMAMAKAWPNGLDEVARVLAAAGRDEDDVYLWATLSYLSSLLPEADADAIAWTSLVRARRGIGNVARGVVSAQRNTEAQGLQGSLFDREMVGETP
jgi:adenine-specific DNA methylase